MRWKKYKPGDRIFYEGYDGSIESSIVLEVEEKEYEADKGYPVKYQWLKTDEYTGIENYCCLPINSPKIKDIKEKYVFYDKKKPTLIASIEKVLSPLTYELKIELLKELQVKLSND